MARYGIVYDIAYEFFAVPVNVKLSLPSGVAVPESVDNLCPLTL